VMLLVRTPVAVVIPAEPASDAAIVLAAAAIFYFSHILIFPEGSRPNPRACPVRSLHYGRGICVARRAQARAIASLPLLILTLAPSRRPELGPS
jgi:hypothetical protein